MFACKQHCWRSCFYLGFKNGRTFLAVTTAFSGFRKTQKTSLLKGLFGSKPRVWPFLMFVHFVIGISFLGLRVLLYNPYDLHGSIFFRISWLYFYHYLNFTLFFWVNRKDRDKNQMKDLHDFMIKVLINYPWL